MPRSQANLKLSILRGLRGLTIEAKLLYVALLVEPSLTTCGVGVYRLDWWAREAELKYDQAERAFDELEQSRYAFADLDTGEVLVRTLIRRDGIADKPNMLWSACRAALLVQSEMLRGVIAEELRKLPPKPAATMGRNGRMYEHPDPHAFAAALNDPGVDPDGPGRGTADAPESVDNSVDNPSDEPISNGSGTYLEPIEIEPMSNLCRTTGGGGSGSGSSSSPIGSSVGGSRATGATRARLAATPPDLRRCRRHADLPPEDPGPPCVHCRDHRLAAERASIDADNELLTVRARAAEARDACTRCDTEGWIVGDDRRPVEPARRCGHGPELRIVAS